MKNKFVILAVLFIGVFLVGCTQSQSGYSTYNQQPQGQQQGQYVGGGCGVAPNAAYEVTPIEALNPVNSNL